jgi:hypothetical protein
MPALVKRFVHHSFHVHSGGGTSRTQLKPHLEETMGCKLQLCNRKAIIARKFMTQ